MAVIPGGVKVAGFISPSDTTDEYPVIDPVYGIGGFVRFRISLREMLSRRSAAATVCLF
jgi:hypothetical protein